MPQRDHHSASIIRPQDALEQEWHLLVQDRLPADLEAQARWFKAFVRARELDCAADQLRALLHYVFSHSSLREISGWSRLMGVSRSVLSAQAWNQRLLASADWLLWLFNSLLAAPRWQRCPASGRLLLVDATHVSSRHSAGGTWRLHTAYELLAGQVAWVHVSSTKEGEGFGHLPLQAGDVLVADAAYSRVSQVLGAHRARAWSLIGYSPMHLPLYAAQAQEWSLEYRLDVLEWLRGLRPGLYERCACVVEDGECVRVRLVAQVLPEEQAEALRRRKQRQARQHGRTLSQEALFLAGFILLITTLPATRYSTQQLVDLYRCRWHIEVFFKRIKQVLDLHSLPAHTERSAQAMILALLVGWLLIEDEVAELRRQMSDGAVSDCPLSDWRLARLAFEGLCQVVKGSWTPSQLRALAPQLRPLFVERRSRPLREHQRRYQFCEQVLCQSDLVVLFGCSSA